MFISVPFKGFFSTVGLKCVGDENDSDHTFLSYHTPSSIY